MAVKFSVVKKGYEPKEVEAYIEKLEASIDEYRQKEGAISNALISAEAASKQIIKAAEEKARDIIVQAQDEMTEEITSVEKMIASEKKALDEFCSEYDTIVKNYFTGNAFEITNPLREKLNLIECILAEQKDRKVDLENGDAADSEGDIAAE